MIQYRIERATAHGLYAKWMWSRVLGWPVDSCILEDLHFNTI